MTAAAIAGLTNVVAIDRAVRLRDDVSCIRAAA